MQFAVWSCVQDPACCIVSGAFSCFFKIEQLLLIVL